MEWLAPGFRMESADETFSYGIEADVRFDVPQNVIDIMPANIEGSFLLCPLGYETSVPYDSRPIKMVCMEEVLEGHYERYFRDEIVEGDFPSIQ